MKLWERFHTGDCKSPAINCVVVGERCDSLRSHLIHVSGVTVALLIPNQLVRVQILGDVLFGPVVQRRRHLFYTQETMVRFHPGLLDKQRLDTPTGRAARFKPECLQVRLLLWALWKSEM